MNEELLKLLRIEENSPQAERDPVFYRRHFKRYLETLSSLEWKRNWKVLDVGSSPSHLARILKNYGCDVYAIDFYDQPQPDISTHMMNVEKEDLPFDDCTFDVVLFTEVIEHLVYGPFRPVREIYRVLKRGGKLILTTPNAWDFRRIFAILVGQNPFTRYDFFYDPKYCTLGDERSLYSRHTFIYTWPELLELCRKAGFINVEHKYCSFKAATYSIPDYVDQSSWVSKKAYALSAFIYSIITRLFKRYRDSLLVIASKGV